MMLTEGRVVAVLRCCSECREWKPLSLFCFRGLKGIRVCLLCRAFANGGRTVFVTEKGHRDIAGVKT